MQSVLKATFHSMGRAILGFALVLLVWWFVADTAWAKRSPQRMWLAHPRAVSAKVGELLFADAAKLPEKERADLKQDRDSIVGSVARIVPGFLLVFALGIPIGMALGYLTRTYRVFEGPLDFWRSIPPLAVLPICFFVFPQSGKPWLFDWLKTDDQARIASVVFGCLPILVFQVADTFRNIPIERRDFANQIRASIYFKFRWLYLFELMPAIFVSLRTVVCFSVIIIVAGEMAWGAGNGLGDRIIWTRNAENGLPASYAFAIITGAIGYFVNVALRWAEQRVITWK